MKASFDNIFWAAMNGAQRAQSAGTDRARRYARGYSPILAFADPDQPALDDLLPHAGADERLYVADWGGAAPPGWKIEVESRMHRMVWTAPRPPSDEPPDARPLTTADAAQAVDLAARTQPGPFGPRTLELGTYLGCFDADGRLLAMAGERAHAPGVREISGVCTDPAAQGRGLARRLMSELIRRELQRGETPFLHVMHTNTHALALYRRMGFETVHEPVVRVVSRG